MGLPRAHARKQIDQCGLRRHASGVPASGARRVSHARYGALVAVVREVAGLRMS